MVILKCNDHKTAMVNRTCEIDFKLASAPVFLINHHPHDTLYDKKAAFHDNIT